MADGIAKLTASNPKALAGATPESFEALKNNTAVIKTFSPEPVTIIGFIVAFFLRETPLRTSAAAQHAREEAAGESLG